MKKKIWYIIVIAILFSGCAKKQDDKLVIGIIKPSLNHLPLDMAIKMGYLDKSTIELKQFAAGWETNEALISGQIDVAILPFTYIWTAVSQNKPVKIVSFLERESDGIISSSSIDSVKQLENKKIGLLRSSTLDLFWESLAEQKGLAFQPCYFRTPMDMVAALQTGNVDALSFYIPSIYMLGEDFNIIHWYGNDFPSHPCCDLAVNTDNMADKQDQLKKLLVALKDGCETVGDNYETRKLISANYGLQNDLISPSLKNIEYRMGLDEEGKKVESDIALKMLQKGYIKTEVDPSDVYLQLK